MSDKFDPYREALVVEAVTLWPDQYADWDASERDRIERALHAAPAEAAELHYVRMHTGFRREITVTPADLARLSASQSERS